MTSTITPREASEDVADSLARKSEASALRLLTQAIVSARRVPDDRLQAQLRPPPRRLDDVRWDTLLRAMYRQVFEDKGVDPPAWTSAEPLSEEWWVGGDDPVLRRRAERQPVVPLLGYRIRVSENDLVRL